MPVSGERRPRIRALKPEFFSDERINLIPVGARYTALGLMSMADDRGRIKLMLPQVFAYVFPNGDISENQFKKALRQVIDDARFAWEYTEGHWNYLWLPRFWRHQVINKPSDSTLPPHPRDPYRLLPIKDALAQFKQDTDDGIDRISDSATTALVPSYSGSTPVALPEASIPHAQARGSRSVPFPVLEPLKDTEGARGIFSYWQQTCGHPDAKFTRDRRAAVEARLKEGYTVEQIRTGIDGAARGAYVNDAGKRFDDLELICRKGSKLESFIERAGLATVANGRATPAQTAEANEYDQAADAKLRGAV